MGSPRGSLSGTALLLPHHPSYEVSSQIGSWFDSTGFDPLENPELKRRMGTNWEGLRRMPRPGRISDGESCRRWLQGIRSPAQVHYYLKGAAEFHWNLAAINGISQRWVLAVIHDQLGYLRRVRMYYLTFYPTCF